MKKQKLKSQDDGYEKLMKILDKIHKKYPLFDTEKAWNEIKEERKFSDRSIDEIYGRRL